MLSEGEIKNDAHPVDNVFEPQNYMGDDLGGRDKLYDAKGLLWYPAETDVSIRPNWFYVASQDTAVKSVDELVDIYFNSVGKNSVLLLNVPPDKGGLITKYDVKSLMGFHKIIAETFRDDLVKDAKLKIGGQEKELKASSFFGKDKYWMAKEGVDTASIEFKLPKSEAFDVAMLQEEILVGQRIEKFHVDYWTGKDWQKLTGGTTVGYRRLLRFNPVKTDRVRLVIEESRLNPTLANFGLFRLARLSK
jgi:alpha-L-fucosidase